MQNNKLILLAVLVIFAVISIIYGISTPSKNKRAASVGSEISNTAAAPADTKAVVHRRAKRTAYKTWKQSPFELTGSPQASNLVLSGILGSGTNLKAVIGGEIVGKGGKINGNTVVDIRRDSVVLNDGAKDFMLKLEQ